MRAAVKRTFLLVILGALLTMTLYAQDPTPLEYGESVDDTLDEDRTRATYTFEGSSGTEVTITMVSEDMDPYLVLLDSSGDVLTEDDDSAGRLNAQIVYTLPADDTYTTIATSLREYRSAGEFFSVGGFTLTLDADRIPEPEESEEAETETDEAEEDTAEAETEESAEADADEAETEDAESAEDEAAEEESSEEESAETDEAEDETAEADTDEAAEEEPAVEEVSRPAGDLSFGEMLEGRLSGTDPVESYTFGAAAGDVVSITLNSTQFDAFLTLLDEDGDILIEDDDSAGDLDAQISAFPLTETGLYTVEVNSFENVAGEMPGTGTFMLRVDLAEVQTVELGETAAGEVGPMSVPQAYRFSGEAGDIVALRLETASPSLVTRLSQVEGDLVQESAIGSPVLGPVTLPETGDYTVVVDSFDPMADADYSLTFEPIFPTLLGYNREVSSTFNGVRADYYQFTGDPGDVINVRVESDGTVDTVLYITGPDGAELAFDDDSGPGFDPEINNLELTERGRYTVVVEQFIPGDDGSYRMIIDGNALLDLDEGPQVARISFKQAPTVAVFDGVAGETVVLNARVLAGAQNEPRIVVTQDGAFVAATSIGQVDRLALEFTVPSTGQVEVAVETFAFDELEADPSVIEFSLDRLDD